MPLGTIINSGAVIVGSFIGFLAGKELPERIRSIVFQAIGIATLIIGFKMSIETQNILILILMLLGLTWSLPPLPLAAAPMFI